MCHQLISLAVKYYNLQCSVSSAQSSTARRLFLGESLQLPISKPPAFRDDAFREDGQAHRVRSAAVSSSRCSRLCSHGEICRRHKRCESTGCDYLLACGGCFNCLRNLCDPAGVGSSQIRDPEETEIPLRNHTVVSHKILNCLSGLWN